MEQEEGTFSVPVIWRGKKFTVTIKSGASLKEFGDEVKKLTDVKADTLKLIVPQSPGKTSMLLEPFSDQHAYLTLHDTSILKVKSIRMMGVLKEEVDDVLKSAKENQRIIGFEEEENRMKMLRSSVPFSSLKLPIGQYIFSGFQTLELPGIKLNPPPSEALKRMHMLAADPGIVAIMNKHRWRVGIMTELAPVGYVGISPKCLLGFNKNQGEEISLRLRTDDLKGFRKYESIRKTLLHELAHMVYSEHDANFYSLDKQLKQEANTLDWTRSSSHTLSGFRSWDPDNVDAMLESETITSHRLGGRTTDMSANVRATSVAAAYHRFSEAISARELEESDPDDSMIESGNGASVMTKNKGKERFQMDEGPNLGECSHDQLKSDADPDDSSQDQGKFEPDPDDSANSGYMESDPYAPQGIDKVEPDPDDTEMSSVLHSVTRLATNKREKIGHEESDIGDVQMGSFDYQLMQSEEHIAKMVFSSKSLKSSENDGVRDQNDHTEAKLGGEVCNIEPTKFTQAEPDPDDKVDYPSEISGDEISHSEPDPHDEELHRIQDPVEVFCNRLTKAIETLRAEVSPMDIFMVLQTLLKVIRNVLESPFGVKYRRLRKTNPAFQKSIANYKAAMDILFLVGFSEDAVMDESGKAETYVVLKRDDPGLLWLAKSYLEVCIS